MTTEEQKKKFLEEYKKLALKYGFDMVPHLVIDQPGAKSSIMVPFMKMEQFSIKPGFSVVELPENASNKAE